METNYSYILASYLTAFVLLAALSLKIVFGYYRQRRINQEFETYTQTSDETKA